MGEIQSRSFWKNSATHKGNTLYFFINLNLLAALMVLLGEETEVYSYLNPLIKLLVSVLLSIHLFYVLIQILVNLSGLHPHRFHIQEKVFFARLYYEAAFENSRITVFCGEANQADDLPNLLFGQRDPSSHVLIFSPPERV